MAVATLYRAEALRKHSGRATRWKGKWHPDPTRAVVQATRWQRKEPLAEVSVVTHHGGKISVIELEKAQMAK